MSSPYDDDVAHFCVTFTRAVIAWNTAEDAARNLLLSLSKGGLGAQAAITHLGNIALLDALRTVVSVHTDLVEQGSQEEAEHINHLISGLDIMRGYRNFYVHSIKGIGKKPQGGAKVETDDHDFVGLMHATEAKGRLAYINQYVTTAELVDFMRRVGQLSTYGNALQNVFANRNGLAGALSPPPQLLSSLEKPIWPEKLKKNRSYLTGRQLLPEPSPE